MTALRGRLVTPTGALPKRGIELGRPLTIDDAIVAWTDGVISYAGTADGYTGGDARPVEGTIVPGFVDCHTHLPFIGWRADEFAARRAGRTYKDLHGEGGIYRSARMLAEASDAEVLDFCRSLLREALVHGTTALEFKTGYGLSMDAELRQARLAHLLSKETSQETTTTLLACHAVPGGVDRRDWVRTVCEELIPRAASEGLVDAVDVYVEDIAFTVDDFTSVAVAASAAGLRVRAHVEQLTNMNGAIAAARLGAVSADHLNRVDAVAIEVLGRSETISVLLPASTFILGSEPPPARALVAAGAAVAVASDLNPGTSPIVSIPETIAFACNLYGLNAEEALVAATANSACVLGLEDRIGSVEAGKRADIVVLDGTPGDIPYRPGHNPAAEVYSGGELVPR